MKNKILFILLVKGGRKETNEDVVCRTRIRVGWLTIYNEGNVNKAAQSKLIVKCYTTMNPASRKEYAKIVVFPSFY